MKMTNKFLFLLLLFSCRETKTDFSFPDSSTVNEIIKTIVLQDSLPCTKDFGKNFEHDEFSSPFNPIPVSLNLDTVSITGGPESIPGKYPISYFANIRYREIQFFSESDREYILFQGKAMGQYSIDPKMSNDIVFTTLDEQNKRESMGKQVDYFSMSVPILSLDQKRAYVVLTKNCPDCGYGDEYFLENTKGKWRILEKNNMWIN